MFIQSESFSNRPILHLFLKIQKYVSFIERDLAIGRV